MINKTIILFLVILLSFIHNLFPQSTSESFIKALINNEDVTAYADKDELLRSQRLGITYTGVKNKFLISYDIDDNVKSEIRNNNIAYSVNEKKLEENYSIIEFTVPSKGYVKKFYLKSGKFISPAAYFSRDWQRKESKYFIFSISEPKYFNDYCVKKLDEFIDSTCTLLRMDESRKQQLEREKIYYIMCKDDNEIDLLTGYKARGIFITAFDEVITTYNTHYHELAHLLINYKLQNLSLHTLPFFLEGFANALGGRGGISKNVVLDIGYYLQKSGFITYDSIITNDGFYKEDASLTYPVAGLYNLFLMKEIGMEKYLEMYKKVNGNLDDIRAIETAELNLPGKDEFNIYLKLYEEVSGVSVDDTRKVNSDYYMFSIDSIALYKNEEKANTPVDYVSKKFNEVFKKDPNEICIYKYGIIADSLSISVYNFLTNEIIASYSLNFSIDRKLVPNNNGKYEFYIRKDVFDGEFKQK